MLGDNISHPTTMPMESLPMINVNIKNILGSWFSLLVFRDQGVYHVFNQLNRKPSIGIYTGELWDHFNYKLTGGGLQQAASLPPVCFFIK